MNLAARAAFAFSGAILYLGASILVYGGWRAFFSHPPLIAVAIVLLVLSVAAIFAGGNLSTGLREDRSNRWVLIPIMLLGLAGDVVLDVDLAHKAGDVRRDRDDVSADARVARPGLEHVAVPQPVGDGRRRGDEDQRDEEPAGEDQQSFHVGSLSS